MTTTANSAKLAPVTVRVDDLRDYDTATLRETLACVEHTLAQLQKRRTALVAALAERDATTANSPERFPRHCSECGEGMRTGYQHEEDSGLAYCSLDCAAVQLEMTTDELEEAYDNAVNGREAKRPSREALVTYEEWMDSPHEDYEEAR